MSFPEVNIPETKKTDKWAEEFIEAAKRYHQTNAKVRDQYIKDNYNSYNGIVKESTKKAIIEKYGKELSTKYIDFKLGFAKIKLLKGEFLDIEFSPTVNSVNPDKLDKRIEFANMLAGAAELKEYLGHMKKAYGVEAFNGMDIPQKGSEDLKSKMYPKTQNEIFMQTIINEKIEKLDLKLKALSTFLDILVVSECHAVVERDNNNIDIIRVIRPDFAVFQEIDDDPYCDKSPFKGEKRMMYVKDILQQYDIKKEDILKLRTGIDSFRSSNGANGFENINGIPAEEVYTIQWKTPKKVVTKISPTKKGEIPYMRDIDPKDYDKHKTKHDKNVAAGHYKIEIGYKEDLWAGTLIGEDIFTNVGRVENQLQKLNQNKKYIAEYDYVNFLFGTVDGIRISLQAIMSSLSEVNNVLMHMIVRELSKMKGKVLVYDEALKPKNRSMKSIFFDMSEHGVVRINSSAEGNFSDKDVTNAIELVKELDLGLSSSFEVLLRVKDNIEQTMDRVTGINETREGYAKASQTATGTQMNIEASRSITKEYYYAHQRFMNRLFTNLAEKTKQNEEWLASNHAKILFGEEQMTFIKATEDIPFDDYDIVLSDGRKEKEIRDKVSRFFDAEINAGNLRSQDVIKFDITTNINEAMAVLNDAWETLELMRQTQRESQEKQTMATIESNEKMAKENREDIQAHEKELKQMEIDSKERVTANVNQQKTDSDIIKSNTNN